MIPLQKLAVDRARRQIGAQREANDYGDAYRWEDDLAVFLERAWPTSESQRN